MGEVLKEQILAFRICVGVEHTLWQVCSLGEARLQRRAVLRAMLLGEGVAAVLFFLFQNTLNK